jgi:hypothetical protein
MKSRLARFSVLFLPVMGLMASITPPAHAFAVSQLVMAGQVTVGNGIAHPCLTGQTTPPSIDIAKCNSTNVAPFTFTGSAVGVTVKVNKAKCDITDIACVQVATYSISASGTIVGACGSSTGSGSGSITKQSDILETKESSAAATFSFSFVNIANALIVTGTFNRPGLGTGTIFGTPLVSDGPPGSGSCMNKAPKTLTIAGPLTILCPNF